MKFVVIWYYFCRSDESQFKIALNREGPQKEEKERLINMIHLLKKKTEQKLFMQKIFSPAKDDILMITPPLPPFPFLMYSRPR